MTTMKEKALDLLRLFIERKYQDAPMPAPSATPPTDEDDSVWERTEALMDGHVINPKRLERDMAEELREMFRPMTRTVTKDGINFRHVTIHGLRELKRLSRHPACRRVVLCTKCALKADVAGEDRPMACSCPSHFQRWIWKFVRQVDGNARQYRWHVAYVLLIVRDTVQHWNQNRLEVERPKDAVPKLYAELVREEASMTRRDAVEYDEYDDNGEYVSTRRFTPTDGTTRSALDLRGWDRPSSMGRRTQRLAFCPECMMLDNPWFLVARSLPFGEAKCNHQRDGKVCGAAEVTPPQRDPNKRPPTYTVRRQRRAHGTVEVVEHVFYRQRGRWYAERTHEQTHLMLNHQLERRWLAQLKSTKQA